MRTEKLRWISYIIILVALLIPSIIVRSVEAKENWKIKFAYETTPAHHKSIFIENFAKKLPEYTNGLVTCRTYSGAALYSTEAEALIATSKGAGVQITAPEIGHASVLLPEYQVYALPFLFSSFEDEYKLLDGPLKKDFAAFAAVKNLKLLGFIPHERIEIITSKRMMRMPEDFKKIVLRAPPFPILQETIIALDGSPVAITAGELYMALQKGIADGACSSVSHMQAIKAWEVKQKYLTLCGLQSMTYPILVNLTWWNKLPTDIQEGIQRLSNDMIAKERADLVAIRQRDIKVLRDHGIQVYELTSEERNAWEKKISVMRTKWGKRMGGEEWVNKVQETVKRAK